LINSPRVFQTDAGSPSGDLDMSGRPTLIQFFEFLANLKPGEVVPLKTPQGFRLLN